MTGQPRHPHPRPGARHPRQPPPGACRALAVLGALLPSLAAAAPATSATSPSPEPPPGPPPPPPAVPAAGLPLWAVLVIIGGTIALSAATTLITLALHPTPPWRRPPPPAGTPANARHQPPPPARPATREHPSAATPPQDPGNPSHQQPPTAHAAGGTKPCDQEGEPMTNTSHPAPPRHRRRLAAAGLALAGLVSALFLAAAPAQASQPAHPAATTSVPVTIHSTVIIGPFTGTWSASGGISDSGTLIERSVNFVGNGQLHIVRDVTGSQGTFTLRIDSTAVAVEPNGSVDFTGYWVVISGTGAYADLHGQGTRSAVADNGVVTETLTGSVHYD